MRSALLRLTVALLLTGCASLPPPGQGTKLGYMPRAAMAEGGTGGAHLNTLASPHEPEEPEPRDRRRNVQAGSRSENESARRSATATRYAVLGVIGEMEGSSSALASSLPRFTARGQAHDVFNRYAMYGATQLKWIHRALAGATALTDVAVQVSEPEMELGVLRMTGPRLQAAMFGTHVARRMESGTHARSAQGGDDGRTDVDAE